MKSNQTQVVAAVINICGKVGKTTFCHQCLSPLIPSATLVEIEDWNSSRGAARVEISSRRFFDFATQLNADDLNNYIIDIGASNSKAMFSHFETLASTVERITHWIVPTRAGVKESLDTLKTIDLLFNLDVNPSLISVVAQAVTDLESFERDFSDIAFASCETGFNFASQAVLFTPVFEYIKGTGDSVFDIVSRKPDFKAMRMAASTDEEALMDVGHQMLIYDLARAAVRNYRKVFESLHILEIENVKS
jgi:hypothetical protein